VGSLLAEVSILRRLIGARLRGEMQYRKSFFLQMIGNFLVTFVELITLLILFGRFGTLSGWSVAEVAFLYGLSQFSFAIAHTLSAGFTVFAPLVRQGGFDRILVRPIGLMIQVLGEDFQLRRLGQALQGLLVFSYALSNLDLDWTWGRLLYLPVVILSAVLLFSALFSLEATLCFWTTEGTEVINAFTYGGSALTQYPLHIFDVWPRRLFLSIIPLGLVIYTPSLYLLDKSDPHGLPAFTQFLAPFAAIAFAMGAGAAWRVGVRHYHSTGT